MLRGEAHVTRPAARRAAANRPAGSAVSSPTPSPSRSSQRLTWSSWHSLLAAAESEYPLRPQPAPEPRRIRRQRPDTTGTHTFWYHGHPLGDPMHWKTNGPCASEPDEVMR